jgi:hypothetical protein
MKTGSTLALAILALAAPASGKDKELPYREYKAGEPVVLAPDTAYLLVRSIDLWGFRFVRIAGDDGSVADRGEFAEFPGYRSFDKSLSVRTHVLAVRPGTYWLYGEKTGFHLEGPFLNCLCMGTIRFDAKPGVITDLGMIRDLAKETGNGKRPDARGVTHQLLGNAAERAILVEPVSDKDPVPASLAALTRVPADYRAAGSLPNLDGTMVDRISVMPGILRYERDEIVDVKTGQRLR